MNRYIKTFVSLLLLLIATNACKESFLEEEVLDAYSPEALNDKLGFEAAIVGLHNQFGSFYRTTNDQTLIGMFHLGTDIVWAPSGRSNGDARNYFNYSTLTPQDNASRKLWEYLYRVVSNANIIIQGAADETLQSLTQAEKDAFSAEARFFRAHAYNMLVTLYGGVPLVTEALSAPKTDFTRASVDEVNGVIVEDLEFAVEYLPEIDEAPQQGRINKMAARQLLAEVYLRIGQPEDAEDLLDAIIGSDRLQLVTERYGVKANEPGDPFADMFIFGNQRRSQGNTEAIWVMELENPADVAIGNVDNPQQRRVWGAAYYEIPGMLPADSLGGRGIARVRLNNWVIYDLYEENDMRNSQHNIRRQLYFNNPDPLYAPIYGEPVPYGQDATFQLADGTEITINAADTIYRIPPYTMKWGQFDPRDTFGYGMWKDFIMMRLGETYLLRAEARFRQDDFEGAAADINELRKRANASLVDQGDITLDLILDERVRELIAEENRRMTLVRTGRLYDRARELTGTTKLADGNIETTEGLQQYHNLLPIPQTEINLNKDAELSQNTGYTGGD